MRHRTEEPRSEPSVAVAGENHPERGGQQHLAVGITAITAVPPLPLVVISIVMGRERQKNDGLGDCRRLPLPRPTRPPAPAAHGERQEPTSAQDLCTLRL